MDWLGDANTRWVLAGCMLLGASSGILGSFALLRRRSLMGDALAHAALPGVCLAFLATGARSIEYFMVGALIAGVVAAFSIQSITRFSRIKEDAALGLVLSVFFAVGIVLLTLIQHSGRGNQAGLDKFLFGQAASLVGSDVRVMAICAAVVVVASLALFKEFKLLCFDASFAHGQGFAPGLLDGLLNVLIVVAVVIGMQAVGVVLMAAMLITPPAAARLWTDRLGVLVAIAGGVGALSGLLGTVVSAQAVRMPTGPLIVLSATGVFIFSFFFAPRKGLLARLRRLLLLRATVARENVLRSMYEVAESAGSWDIVVSAERIAEQRGRGVHGVTKQVRPLVREGLLRRSGEDVSFTEAGLQAAYHVVRNHRLWEMFLMHESQLAADHVDRDADFIEHFLSVEIVGELERLLEIHGREPKLPPSVHPIGATV
ncbi:MAG: metal ABC transporter permease [Candidatus Krumholzibacteriia bacterium]